MAASQSLRERDLYLSCKEMAHFLSQASQTHYREFFRKILTLTRDICQEDLLSMAKPQESMMEFAAIASLSRKALITKENIIQLLYHSRDPLVRRLLL